jgi:hypothetical protein
MSPYAALALMAGLLAAVAAASLREAMSAEMA